MIYNPYPLVPLGYVATTLAGGTPRTSERKYWDATGKGVNWVAIGDMSGTPLVKNTARRVTQEGIDAAGLTVGEPGTILFAMYASVGAVSRLGIPAAWNQALLGIKPRENRVHADYLAYSLTWLRPSLVFYLRSNTQDNLNAEVVKSLRLPLPDLETQRDIADYLDRETAEIDAMTADLDKMEALLTERRSTSIACSLHSSGGASAPIAAMAHVTLGKMVQPNPKSPSDIAAPYLRAAHVPAPGTLDLSVGAKQMWFSPEELGHLTVHAGDVVVVEGGAGYGRAAFVSADLDGWGFQNSIIRVRPREQVAVGKYIAYALQHAQSEGEIELLVSTATLPHFTAEKVERFRLPLPPLEEQRRIAAEIDREIAEIDAMLADITELRDLLAERRTALIAAAVTGQIDIPTAEEPTHA